eukprot:TRINITY_DN105007_c0_g1_i1.p1 TRINITY_DN105007_c0_g1~~TRINITY_DN105007_c0_g1_i1.p1  ORF type:complete len:375 (-),score=34.21 TRINITY_DN105007_c0_g1_i1:71-1195(-)
MGTFRDPTAGFGIPPGGFIGVQNNGSPWGPIAQNPASHFSHPHPHYPPMPTPVQPLDVPHGPYSMPPRAMSPGPPVHSSPLRGPPGPSYGHEYDYGPRPHSPSFGSMGMMPPPSMGTLTPPRAAGMTRASPPRRYYQMYPPNKNRRRSTELVPSGPPVPFSNAPYGDRRPPGPHPMRETSMVMSDEDFELAQLRKRQQLLECAQLENELKIKAKERQLERRDKEKALIQRERRLLSEWAAQLDEKEKLLDFDMLEPLPADADKHSVTDASSVSSAEGDEKVLRHARKRQQALKDKIQQERQGGDTRVYGTEQAQEVVNKPVRATDTPLSTGGASFTSGGSSYSSPSGSPRTDQSSPASVSRQQPPGRAFTFGTA